MGYNKIKRQKLSCCLKETHFNYKHTRLKLKHEKKIQNANSEHKKVGSHINKNPY
jgi:hypothetical protein